MHSRQVLKNTSAGLLLQMVVSAFGFVTPVLIIRTYGSEINGFVASVSQLIRYFGLLEAGLSGAALFALYRPLSVADFSAVNRILSFVRRYFTRVGILFLCLWCALGPLYVFFLSSSAMMPERMLALFLVIGLSGGLEFLVIARYRVLLTAEERGYIISFVGVAGVVLQQSMAILLILASVPVEVVYFTTVPVLLARGLTLRYAAMRIFKSKTSFRGQCTRKESGIRFQGHVLMHEVGYTINQASPLVAVSLLYGLGTASVFAVYSMPIMMVTMILATFYQSVTPSIGRIAAQSGAKATVAPFSSFLFWHYSLSSWLLSCTVLLVTPFVSIYTRGVQDVQYRQPEFGYALVAFAAANAFRVGYATQVSAFGLFKPTALLALCTGTGGLIIACLAGTVAAPLVLVGPIVALILNALGQAWVVRCRQPDAPIDRNITYATLMALVTMTAAVADHVLALEAQTWPGFAMMAAIVAAVLTLAVGFVFGVASGADRHQHVGYILRTLRTRTR